MFIGIILSIALAFGIISVFGGVVKKFLEIISLIAKLCLSGFIAMLIAQALSIDLGGSWGGLVFIIIGAIIIFFLIAMLASRFRLVGYSINYFIDSILILLVASILQEKLTVTFLQYAITLFLLPRVMWISDRFATTTEYSHTEYSALRNTETTFYTIKHMDWWGNPRASWDSIPLQIVIASLFYAVGSITVLATCPIESPWMTGLFIVLAIAINVLFDFFVFRKFDVSLD